MFRAHHTKIWNQFKHINNYILFSLEKGLKGIQASIGKHSSFAAAFLENPCAIHEQVIIT